MNNEKVKNGKYKLLFSPEKVISISLFYNFSFKYFSCETRAILYPPHPQAMAEVLLVLACDTR